MRIVCLVGGSALGRMAYRLLLREALHIEVAVESDFRPTSVWAAMRAHPEVAVVEADSPRPEVLDAVEMMIRLSPELRVLVVSAAVEPELVEPWARQHLAGYVVKDAGMGELRAAVEAVLRGREYFSAGIAEILTRATWNAPANRLSPREKELLPLLARGLTLRDAAAAMSISYKTADSYRTSLLRKLNIRDRVELARYAIRQRIIEP